MSVEPEFPKTPFFSARNVPFWGGLVIVAIIGGLIRWLH